MSKFNFDIESQTITIDGKVYGKDNFHTLHSEDEKLNSFYSGIISFLKSWWDDIDTTIVHTSGSTGKPKTMLVAKRAMMASAENTLSFLNLKKGDNALLCMPVEYIAGKMMIVRALVGGINLICRKPSGEPLKDLNEKLDFAAMIPLQIFNSLNDEHQKVTLMNIREVIIGGGAIDANIEDILSSFNNNIWSTYGMTETLSHIAMRKISGYDRTEWYSTLNNIKVSLTSENTLVIDAPQICKEQLITNDIAQINESGEFKIIGRRDNIINSGGIKIQIEEVENRLKESINTPFMITSKKDNKFGEIIVILVQGKDTEMEIEEICKVDLPQYWRPKEIVFVDSLPMTGSGKPDRAKAKIIANSN